jgi:hypothetical protein
LRRVVQFRSVPIAPIDGIGVLLISTRPLRHIIFFQPWRNATQHSIVP